jgi:hypothetical protein
MRSMRRLASTLLVLAGAAVIAVAALGVVFRNSWSWGDVPTWIGAMGTIGLLAGAIVTAVFAVQAFHEQSKEVTILESQLSDQRALALKQMEVLSLQAEEIRASLEVRRREQAVRVFTWVEATDRGRGRFVVHVTNESERPIYGLTFSLGYHRDAPAEYSSPPQAMRHLMPHSTAVFKPEEHEDSILWGTSWEADEVWSAVHFRDASGETWQTNSLGQLESAPAIPE